MKQAEKMKNKLRMPEEFTMMDDEEKLLSGGDFFSDYCPDLDGHVGREEIPINIKEVVEERFLTRDVHKFGGIATYYDGKCYGLGRTWSKDTTELTGRGIACIVGVTVALAGAGVGIAAACGAFSKS